MNTGCGVRASRAPHSLCVAERAKRCKRNLDRLVVIGAHSSEFAFEKTIDEVCQAAKALNIAYPVAVDNDHSIWDAFDNQYWPALYFVDAHARIHSGCVNVMAHQLDQPSLRSVHATR
jgi:hypothetical protein